VKVKRQPEDFRVEELTDVVPQRSGLFALYRLTKRGVGTPEAVESLLRRWKMPRQRVSYGGLKDKHAVTVQHLTIQRGPARDLKQSNVDLKYLGQTARAFGPTDIRANRFGIVLRSMTEESVARALRDAPLAARDGVPNYFDDQRFGSVGESGDFIGATWIKGDYERCLWLAFAEPNPFDRADEKREKQVLRDHWGRWTECKAQLGRSHRRSIVTFLDDRPGDFRGAWARVNVDLRRLYLSAFQSELWNRLLAACLREQLPAENLVDVGLKTQSVPFYRELNDEARAQLQALELPLPAARQKLEPGPIRDLAERCLGEAGLEWRELRVKYPRDSFFSKGWRRAVVVPENLSAKAEPDDLDPSRSKVLLDFTLPRGAYATILVKRLTDGAGD
jgi:tRNA pseudouridine13 synthase